MSLLSTEELNHIRESVDLVDVVKNYVPLTQRGKNYFGVCPFHEDRDPSMSVSKDKQIYTCFSCHATGNVFKFVMDYEHLPFLDAVKKVASWGGVSLHDSVINHTVKSPSKLYEIYEIAQKFYLNNLQTIGGQVAKEYLFNRKIDESIVKEFGIGLSLKNRELLTKLLLKKGYDESILIKSGLVNKNEYGLSDLYNNRIMFPLEDLNGKVVGYSGRIFDTNSGSKYINSKETEIFKKGELLYNYFRSKEECRRTDTVYIMEGFMDVIAAYQVDVKNTIAMMGTAVTHNQATLIKRMARNVVLCFDGDGAGQKATISCANELLKLGVIPKVVMLEENLDPDEYIKKYGADIWKQKMANPISIMEFKLYSLKNNKNLNNSAEMAQYINQAMQELTWIDDEILRELTLKKISEESHLDLDFLRKKLNDQTLPVVPKEPPKANQKMDKPTLIEKAEREFLFYMLRSKEVIKMFQKKITYLPTERYRFFAREIIQFYKVTGGIELADFITNISTQEQLMKTLGEIESNPLNEQYTIDQIEDYIRAINYNTSEKECDRLREQMKKELNFEKKATLAQQIIEIEKKIRGEEHV